MTPAAQEASQINSLIPNPYYEGQYYPVEYAGHSIQIARKRGRGNNSRCYYLHILHPCTVVLTSPDGEILSKRDDFRHYSIRLYDEAATWKER